MSLSRYSPHLGQAFLLPMSQPIKLLRLAGPWLALALAVPFLAGLDLPGGPLLPFALNAIAIGGFAVAWQRFVARGEVVSLPHSPVMVGRVLAWAVANQVLTAFENLPAPFINIMYPTDPTIGILAVQLFQLLIGAMFLLLPHISLWRRQDERPNLQEMVLAGGLAVGLGYAVTGLPFMVMSTLLNDILPSADGIEGRLAQVVVSFLAVTVSAGYFALVWQELRSTAPVLNGQAAEVAPVADVKPVGKGKAARRKGR